MASRLARYVRRLAILAVVLAAIGLALWAIQSYFHPFDALLAKGLGFVDEMDAKLSNEAFKGITIGSLALILALCIFPLFLKRIDDKAYWRGLWRGVIAAAVYFLSSKLFEAAASLGRVRLIVVMLAAIVVGIIVVEGVSLAVREEDEKSFRTDVVSSIASGFLFGVLVKFAGYGFDLLKGAIGNFKP